MEVTDRLRRVTQVTFQYDIPSYCHSHRTLISAMQRACMPRLPLSLSFYLSLITLYKNNSHTAKCGSANSRQKVMEIIFPVRRGSWWHKYWGNWACSTTMATEWPSKSLELKARSRAGDMPCADYLTWLVMPATRPSLRDFLKRKCVLGIAKNTLICCLLSVG